MARWVFRLGFVLCVMIVAVSVASFWRPFTVWPPSGRAVTLSESTFWMARPTPSGFPRADRIQVVGGFRLWPTTGMGLLVLPTWMFLLVVLIPMLVAWRQLRRKYPPGHCLTCGYNLTGNMSGVCPECATQVKGP